MKKDYIVRFLVNIFSMDVKKTYYIHNKNE